MQMNKVVMHAFLKEKYWCTEKGNNYRGKKMTAVKNSDYIFFFTSKARQPLSDGKHLVVN